MIRSINPSTNEVVAQFEAHTAEEVDHALDDAVSAQQEWSTLPINERAEMVRRLAEEIREQRDHLAPLATLEMGKPIVQSEAELEKCAKACEFFAEHGPAFLAPEVLESG